MTRQLLLLFTTIWTVSSANISNDFVYEDGFVADFNYDVHETSLTSQELQQQQADTGLGILGLENGPSLVTRDLRHQPYAHWILPNPEKTSIEHGHIVKRDISDVAGSLEVSNINDHNEDDAMAEALYEEQLDYYHYHEVPASDGRQQEESLEGYYELDSHEEPAEERAHGVRARQPRDEEEADDEEDASTQLSEVPVEKLSLMNSLGVRQLSEDPVEEQAHSVRVRQPRDEEEANDEDESSLVSEEPVEEQAHSVIRQPIDEEEANDEEDSSLVSEEPVEEQAHSVRVRQPRDEEDANDEDASSLVINKRTISQAAMNFEKARQSAIEVFYAEEAKERSLIEKKKREITGALASDYDGSFTKAELEAAVESALNKYYGQKIVNRLKRAAYMELDYKRARQDATDDHDRQNMIIKVKPVGDKKEKRNVQDSVQESVDPPKWNYI